MKPHLALRRGSWCCALRGVVRGVPFYTLPWGHGYSPEEAFNDWKAQQQ